MTVIDLSAEKVPFLNFENDEHWFDFEKKEEFLRIANPINYEFDTNMETTSVKARPISCYKDSLFLRVEDKTWEEEWAIFYFLYSNGQYFQLGGAEENIWDINADAALNINKRTAVDYVKMMCYFYWVGDYGSHFVLESPESEFVNLLPYSNDLEKTRLLKKITPPVVNGPDNKGEYTVECNVLVGHYFYRYLLIIDEGGSFRGDSYQVLTRKKYHDEE